MNDSSVISSSLFSEYFAVQPTLLCTVLLICFTAGTTAVVFCVFGVARFFLNGCGDKRYQVSTKHPAPLKWYIVFLVGFLTFWLMMGVCALTLVRESSTLKSRFVVDEQKSEINHHFNGTENDRHLVIRLNSVIIEDQPSEAQNLDEMQQLLRFKDVRELGYEFSPLDSDSSHSAHSAVFWTLSVFYGLTVLISGIVVLLGTWQYMLSYHPVDRSIISNYCGTWSIGVACILFAGAPIAMVVASIFLVYAHLHETICPIVQTLTQNQNMEDYINLNFAFFDPNNIVDFLNDLLVERLELNQQVCHSFIAPIQKLWFTILLLTLASLPTIFFLLKLSRFYLKMDAKYYWSQHDTYSTIPDREKGKPVQLFPKFPPKY
uniref:Uncharacterized protein n=1 Tax=Panagrolaimus sp. JU765 TaxID=591449 RepID=A0AC34RQJ5_9BILA